MLGPDFRPAPRLAALRDFATLSGVRDPQSSYRVTSRCAGRSRMRAFGPQHATGTAERVTASDTGINAGAVSRRCPSPGCPSAATCAGASTSTPATARRRSHTEVDPPVPSGKHSRSTASMTSPRVAPRVSGRVHISALPAKPLARQLQRSSGPTTTLREAGSQSAPPPAPRPQSRTIRPNSRRRGRQTSRRASTDPASGRTRRSSRNGAPLASACAGDDFQRDRVARTNCRSTVWSGGDHVPVEAGPGERGGRRRQ